MATLFKKKKKELTEEDELRIKHSREIAERARRERQTEVESTKEYQELQRQRAEAEERERVARAEKRQIKQIARERHIEQVKKPFTGARKKIERELELRRAGQPTREELAKIQRQARLELERARHKGRAEGTRLQEKHRITGTPVRGSRGRYTPRRPPSTPRGPYTAPTPIGGPPRAPGKSVKGYQRYDPATGKMINVKGYTRTHITRPGEPEPQAPRRGVGGILDEADTIFGDFNATPTREEPPTPRKRKSAIFEADDILGDMLL